MNNVITGYKLNGDSLILLESELKKVKNKVQKIANDIYKVLYKEEVEFLFDHVALNEINIEKDADLFEIAKLNLKDKICKSSQSLNKYNMTFNGYLFTDGNCMYIDMSFCNKAFLKAFNNTHFEEYFVNDEEKKDSKNAKTDTWNSLFKTYEDKFEPLFINLSPKISDEDLISIGFDNIVVRAEKIAEEATVSYALAQVSMGEQIPPWNIGKTIVDMLEAIKTKPEYQEYKNAKKNELTRILVDIDKLYKEKMKDKRPKTEK